jgi:addiction module HigA family antidote
MDTDPKAIHPGKILLEEVMTPLGVSRNRLARDIDVPVGRISAIVSGARAITADTALRLGKYFGTTPELWLKLQADYDLAVARAGAWRQVDGRIRVLDGQIGGVPESLELTERIDPAPSEMPHPLDAAPPEEPESLELTERADTPLESRAPAFPDAADIFVPIERTEPAPSPPEAAEPLELTERVDGAPAAPPPPDTAAEEPEPLVLTERVDGPPVPPPSVFPGLSQTQERSDGEPGGPDREADDFAIPEPPKRPAA